MFAAAPIHHWFFRALDHCLARWTFVKMNSLFEVCMKISSNESKDVASGAEMNEKEKYEFANWRRGWQMSYRIT